MLKQRLGEVKGSAQGHLLSGSRKQDLGTKAGGETETRGWVCRKQKRAVSRSVLRKTPTDRRVNVHFKFIIVFVSKCLLIFPH